MLATPSAGQQPKGPGDARLIPGVFHEVFRNEGDFADISSMVFAPTGHLVVVDTDAYEVTVFDVTGRVNIQWGRRGQGPGEFRRPPGRIAVSRDGRFAIDTNSGRIDFFDLRGNLLESHHAGGLSVGDLAFDAESRLLIEVRSPLETERGQILRVADDAVLWSSRPLEPTTSLTLYPAKVLMAGIADIGADKIVVGVTDSYDLAVLDASTGQELGRIARDVAVRGPTPDFVARVKERLGAAVGSRLRAATVERVQFPEAFPVISSVFVGPPGRTVWVQRHMGVADSLAPSLGDMEDSTFRLYDLFTSGGSYDYIGTVQVPDRLELMAGDSTRVAGVYTGALDEQSVRVLRFSRR